MSTTHRVFAAVALATTAACQGPIVAPLNYEAITPSSDDARYSAPPALEPVSSPALTSRTATLPNGVRVVVFERTGMHAMSVRLVADRGSADVGGRPETVEMLARAMRRRVESDPTWARIGASPHVTLGEDEGVLGATVGPADLDAAIGALGAAATLSSLTEADVATAREALLGELDPTSGMSSGYGLPQLLFSDDHPYRLVPVTADRARRVGLSDVLALGHLLYRPAHVTLVVAGDTTLDAMIATATRHLGAWSGDPPIARPAIPRMSDSTWRVLFMAGGATDYAQGFVLVPLPPLTDDELPAVEVLARMLAGVSSNAFREVRDDYGAYAFGPTLVRWRGASALMIGGTVPASRTLPILKRLLAVIRAARGTPPSADDLAWARGSAMGAWRERTTTASELTLLASEQLAGGLPLEALSTHSARLGRVTAADVQRAAARYLDDRALHAFVAGEEAVIGDLRELGLGAIERRHRFEAPAR